MCPCLLNVLSAKRNSLKIVLVMMCRKRLSVMYGCSFLLCLQYYIENRNMIQNIMSME